MKTLDVRERFVNDTKEHEMSVLKDDGLYRHLRFKKPGTSMYWYDIVTWPGNLVIRGDMGAFAFARTEDMFGFFRSGPGINPGYWAEKLTAPDPSAAQTYSEDEFRAQVRQSYDNHVDAQGEPDPDLWERIKTEILDNPDCCDEREARDLLRYFDKLDRPDLDLFNDAWEWDLHDWKYQFLWCCHAIRAAIAAYDKIEGNQK